MAEAVQGAVRDAPKLLPPALSFITATDIIDEVTEEWYAGIWYTPEGDGTGTVHRVCANNAKTAASSVDPIVHRPYLIEANHQTSSFGWQEADYKARATRKLLAVESKLVERELWAAAIETANRPIAYSGATLVAAGSASPLNAMKFMEQSLADNTSGQRYMIHMRPKAFDSLMDDNGTFLHKDPNPKYNRWLTPMDNVVVPGRGYLGTGPAGQAVAATEWVYATPMIYLHRGPIVITPGSLKEATQRDRNLITFYAERVVGTSWDTSVAHLAMEVTP